MFDDTLQYVSIDIINFFRLSDPNIKAMCQPRVNARESEKNPCNL